MTEERTAYRAGKGGKRPGAGRPKGIGNDGPSKKMISVRLDPRIIKWLKSHPAGKRTKIIEEALIRQMDYEDEGLGVEETEEN
jgi:hypothetical protein